MHSTIRTIVSVVIRLTWLMLLLSAYSANCRVPSLSPWCDTILWGKQPAICWWLIILDLIHHGEGKIHLYWNNHLFCIWLSFSAYHTSISTIVCGFRNPYPFIGHSALCFFWPTKWFHMKGCSCFPGCIVHFESETIACVISSVIIINGFGVRVGN